jgi:PAS domain S-box-containing protein
MERLIGLSNREIVGRSDQELFTAEVAAHFREEDEQALSGKIIRIIDAGPFLEGHRTFHKVKVPIYDATGKIVVGLCGIARDITDLKQAEVALRESEERFRMLFEYAPDAYILADAQGEIIDCNQATEDLAGYGREELIGNNFACLPWLDFREQVRLADRLAQAARGEVLGPVSFTLARKDGGELFAEGMSLPLYIQGQNLVLTIARDVTARKQAEAALQESEARYRALFDASPDAIIVIDMGMNFVMGNWRGLEIWGIDSLDQSKFKNATEYIVPEDRPRVMAAMQELMATGRTQTFETTMIKHDGSRFPSLNSAVLIRDSGGRPQAILGIARDISALKQAEAELRESERRFRLMAETIQDVFWIASAGLEKMIYISPGYEQVWGRTCQELYQSPPSFLEAIHPEDRERFEHEIDAAKAQSLAFSEEYRIIRPDKTVRWIQDRGYPVRDGQGRVIMYTGVATDITERKAMEQQLLQAQKMEAVGRLAGGVAHDFNNLLMAITGYGELMRAMVLKDDPLYGYLDNILKVGERAAALTQQLLTFSRQQIVTPQLIDLNRAVLDLEPMLRRLIGEDLDLEVVMDRRLGAVKADPGQLGQIIMNLVVNARDAMPQGGRLTLKTAAVELEKSRHTRFGLAPPGAYVTLVVQDTGVGMDEATQAHAFEPFFTTKELGKGTGLGLSTVYGIVQQSGAYLDLASEPGAGSVFTIYWPRLDQVVEPPREKIAINAGYRGEETILLVEDEDVLRGLLAKFLRLHGYSVLEARHGGEALLNCEQHPGPIHLLVTDVVMPQVSGRELADRLAPLRPEMKIIYMSGYTEDTLVQHGVTELSMAFLQKPFKPIELARRVYAVLHPPGGR